jgi:hypothetical protein
MAEIQPLLYIGPPKNDRSTPALGVTTQASQWHSTHEVLDRTTANPSGLHILLTQAPRSCRVSLLTAVYLL